jgi:hypothetical protein
VKLSSDIVRGTSYLALVILVLAALLGGVIAQDEFPPPPEEDPDKKKKGSLQPRPEDDPKTELWVAKLGASRARPLSTRPGILLHPVMTPDGTRFYYHREESRTDGKDGKPVRVMYVLYSVGADKAEGKVAETGADTTQPLFLGDDRIIFCARRYDVIEDGALDELDDASLMVCNRDGGNLRSITTLRPGETPVAVWNEGREVLLSTAGDKDVNGWIVALNLVRGDRTNVVRGFNVELVLDDGRLLIERQKAPPPERNMGTGWNPWGEVLPETEEPEQPLPSLLDPSEHLIFDPRDGTETLLYGATKRSRFVVAAEGSFFGHQEPSEPSEEEAGWGWFGPESVSRQVSEVLIVDDPEHHDTRSPSARYDYQTIGWINERGLLVIEQGKLGSRLMLFDHALKMHRLADFELNARGFMASRDGLTIGWLEIDDTDKNGYLEPWKDNSRINFIKIE